MDDQIELEVDGQKIVLDVTADCEVTDLTEDMKAIPGLLAWYGRVLAAARRRADTIDAEYRAWRAATAAAYANRDPKMPEHKIKAYVEANPDFLKRKKFQADADELVLRLEKAWAGLHAKLEILRSLGAIERADWSATSVTTRVEVDGERTQPERMTREQKLQAIREKKQRDRNNRNQREEDDGDQ